MLLDCEVEIKQKESNDLFYLGYRKNEENLANSDSDFDPQERLSYFHLAILEQISKSRMGVALQIYQDLLQKKKEIYQEGYMFKEELMDLTYHIVSSLKECGLSVSHLDFF